MAGYVSGTVCLYDLENGNPACQWPQLCAGGVRGLRWSSTRPAVFFALDSARTVHAFDLSKSTQAPVSSTSLPAAADFMALSSRVGGNAADDEAAAAAAATSSSASNAASASSRAGFLAFSSSRAASTVDIHVLSPALSTPVDGERKRLVDLVRR